MTCLNLQGKAAGELYIDDYHTHQYKNLEFAHRMFTYADNKLINRLTLNVSNCYKFINKLT